MAKSMKGHHRDLKQLHNMWSRHMEKKAEQKRKRERARQKARREHVMFGTWLMSKRFVDIWLSDLSSVEGE